MKKITAIVLALAMVLSLAACGETESVKTEAAEAPSAAEKTVPEVTTPEPQAPAEEPEAVKEDKEDKASEIKEIYRALLCDEQEFVIGENVDDFEAGSSYRLSDFGQACMDLQQTHWEADYQLKTSYGYLDCGWDGIPELAVEFTMTDPENNDCSIRYFVISCLDGAPTVVGDYSYYYRSYSCINVAGIVENSGSSGAASHYYDYRVLDGQGEEHFLYSCSSEMDNPKPAIPSYYLPDEFDDEYYNMYPEEEPENYYTVEAYSFENFDYPYDADDYEEAYDEYCRSFFFTITDQSGNDAEPAEEYASLYEENGVKIVTTEEAEAMVAERRAEYGVTDEMLYEVYVDYSCLDAEKMNDQVIENEDGSVTVGCSANLVDSIKDGATIYLKPGVYNLTDWANNYSGSCSFGDDTRCRNYTYADCYNSHIFIAGGQLVVNRVNNLTIASLDPEDPAEIVIDETFNIVMSFCECSDLTLLNLTAGHTAGNEGYCSADVFEFAECDRVLVDRCDLYGCGSFGITATDTAGLDVVGGRIHDCTNGMVELYRTYPVTFNGVAFENCSDEYSGMFTLYESNADFINCSFSKLGKLFYLDSSYAWMDGCSFDEAAESSVRSSEYLNDTLFLYE